MRLVKQRLELKRAIKKKSPRYDGCSQSKLVLCIRLKHIVCFCYNLITTYRSVNLVRSKK